MQKNHILFSNIDDISEMLACLTPLGHVPISNDILILTSIYAILARVLSISSSPSLNEA